MTDEFRERVGRADGFVAVTSEYNHGYPAALKTAFDSVKHEWRSKPIGFVSYGGLAGGLRATEQLRQVVAELHMVSVRQSVSFHRVRKRFDDQGQTTDGAAIDSADRMLAQLVWWAAAVRVQRGTTPYPGSVGPGRVVARQTNSARTAVTFTGECDQPGHTTIGKKPRNATAQVFNLDPSPGRAFGA